MAALASYRELLRATRAAFKSDLSMVVASRTEIRGKFEASRGETDPEAVKRMLGEAKDTADFIKSYVVQGVLNDRGNYEMKLEPHHAEGADRIHAEEALPEVVDSCKNKNKE